MNRLRGRISGSSSACLLPIVSTEAMATTVMRWTIVDGVVKQKNGGLNTRFLNEVPAKGRLSRQSVAAKTLSQELSLPKSQAPPIQAQLKPIQAVPAP